MVGFFQAATIISALSIFAFFGNVFSYPGGKPIPNMFQLMLGGRETYSGYTIVWEPYGGLTFLFVLEIIIIIMAVVTWCVCRIAYDNGPKVWCGMFSGFCSLVAFIISFCTLSITKADPLKDIELGAGPILYSILNIISVLLITGGIIYHCVCESIYTYRIRYAPRSIYGSSSYTSSSKTRSSSSAAQGTQKPPKLSENEKADLFLKYKGLLDSGVITQEEFDSKKKEIL